MTRHRSIVDLLDVIDVADEHDVDLLVDALGLAVDRAGRAARRR